MSRRLVRDGARGSTPHSYSDSGTLPSPVGPGYSLSTGGPSGSRVGRLRLGTRKSGECQGTGTFPSLEFRRKGMSGVHTGFRELRSV